MRISDWSSDVCSSDLTPPVPGCARRAATAVRRRAAATCVPGSATGRTPAQLDRYGERARGPAGHRGARRAGPRARRGQDLRGKDNPQCWAAPATVRSEAHTSELQSLMRISYADFCLKKKKKNISDTKRHENTQYKTQTH